MKMALWVIVGIAIIIVPLLFFTPLASHWMNKPVKVESGVMSISPFDSVLKSVDKRPSHLPGHVKFIYNRPSLAGSDQVGRTFKAWDGSDYGPLLEYRHPGMIDGRVYEISELEYEKIKQFSAQQGDAPEPATNVNPASRSSPSPAR